MRWGDFVWRFGACVQQTERDTELERAGECWREKECVQERKSRRLPREEKKCPCDFTAAAAVVHDQLAAAAALCLLSFVSPPTQTARACACARVLVGAFVCAIVCVRESRVVVFGVCIMCV